MRAAQIEAEAKARFEEKKARWKEMKAKRRQARTAERLAEQTSTSDADARLTQAQPAEPA
eukprot:SAG31_NODE_5859_length_2285_cov_3.783166_3_plen_60_part_00